MVTCHCCLSLFSHQPHLEGGPRQSDGQRLVVGDDNIRCGEGNALGERSLKGDIHLPVSHRSRTQYESVGHVLLVFWMDSGNNGQINKKKRSSRI